MARYPHSAWAPALWTNLGLSYRHDGYFSRALDAWQRAWSEGKDATDPLAKALVDRAVGEFARLYASFGRNTELAALFDEILERPITGSATEAVQSAREELVLSEKDPGHLFICGPLALQSLMTAEGAKPDQVSLLQWYRAGDNGTNLAEVGQLADKAKFDHQLVFREASRPVPVPAVMHWKAGHFAAIIREAGGRFEIHDPVFGHQDFWMSRAALDAEASGYFLVPAHGAKPVAWRDASSVETANVWCTANAGPSVSRYIAGGGAYFYSGYQSRTGQFSAQNDDGSILVLASQSPITYRRQMGDGSVEIYAQSNGSMRSTWP